MQARRWSLMAGAMAVLALALWGPDPPPTRANGDQHDDEHEHEGGHAHAHVPAPLENAGIHVPLSVWTDPVMITRGKEIYTVRCAVCHGDQGDGKGPAGLALPLKPPDFRDTDGVAEMRDNYWFWRVSEGGQVPHIMSAMPESGPATSSGQWPRRAEPTGRTPPGR